MKQIHALAVAATSAIMVVSTAAASGLANGGFESPPTPGMNFSTAPAGFGWTVASGDVDLLRVDWQPASGLQLLDLNGWATGSIYQDVTFSLAGSCTVSFDMSANPGFGPGVKTVRVSLNPVGAPMNILGEYSLDAAGRSFTDLQWVAITTPGMAVNATQTYRLQFTSLDSGPCGPMLDTISLSVIPEPGAATLLLTGIALLCGVRRPPTR